MSKVHGTCSHSWGTHSSVVMTLKLELVNEDPKELKECYLEKAKVSQGLQTPALCLKNIHLIKEMGERIIEGVGKICQ